MDLGPLAGGRIHVLMVSDFNPAFGECPFFLLLTFRVIVRIEDFSAGAEHLRVKNRARKQENNGKRREHKVSAKFHKSSPFL